jgi:hypothetical protein
MNSGPLSAALRSAGVSRAARGRLWDLVLLLPVCVRHGEEFLKTVGKFTSLRRKLSNVLRTLSSRPATRLSIEGDHLHMSPFLELEPPPSRLSGTS